MEWQGEDVAMVPGGGAGIPVPAPGRRTGSWTGRRSRTRSASRRGSSEDSDPAQQSLFVYGSGMQLTRIRTDPYNHKFCLSYFRNTFHNISFL